MDIQFNYMDALTAFACNAEGFRIAFLFPLLVFLVLLDGLTKVICAFFFYFCFRRV